MTNLVIHYSTNPLSLVVRSLSSDFCASSIYLNLNMNTGTNSRRFISIFEVLLRNSGCQYIGKWSECRGSCRCQWVPSFADSQRIKSLYGGLVCSKTSWKGITDPILLSTVVCILGYEMITVETRILDCIFFK